MMVNPVQTILFISVIPFQKLHADNAHIPLNSTKT